MIVLDTHIWIWWVQGAPEITADLALKIAKHEDSGLVVSAISLLEISRAVALSGLRLPIDVDEWLRIACSYPGVQVAPLDQAVTVEAYRLPGAFHKDPADRLIVSTARIRDCEILTLDEKILAYPHVRHA